ncbi:MAG: hypothetical protein AAGJ96_11475 [Pseudomonadota bacterium]
MVSRLAAAILLAPAILVRLLPIYAVFSFLVYFVFYSGFDALSERFFMSIILAPAFYIVVLSALRAGLIHTKQTEAINPAKVLRGVSRLISFQGTLVLVGQFAFMGPALLLLERIAGLPLFSNPVLTLQGITEVMSMGDVSRVHWVFGAAILLYAIPFAITCAFAAPAMVATAATVVRKAPGFDPIWGFASSFWSLLLLFFPIAILLWLSVLAYYAGNMVFFVTGMIGSARLAFLLPILLASAVWLPIFAAGGTIVFREARAEEEAERRSAIEAAMRAQPEEMPDLRALREARQQRGAVRHESD